MSKRDAAEKVAKLMRLARGSSNPHEAANARAQAEKLVHEHDLTEEDLTSGARAAAFDDLVDAVHATVRNHPWNRDEKCKDGMFGTSALVTDVLARIKSIKETDRAAGLGIITGVIRTVSIIAGDNPTIRGMKRTLDDTLRKHDITI